MTRSKGKKRKERNSGENSADTLNKSNVSKHRGPSEELDVSDILC